jgi:hypothetical protein
LPVFRSEKASSLRRSLEKALLKLKAAGQRPFERRKIEREISRPRDELRGVKGQKQRAMDEPEGDGRKSFPSRTTRGSTSTSG